MRLSLENEIERCSAQYTAAAGHRHCRNNLDNYSPFDH
jgi:hypothetical protein